MHTEPMKESDGVFTDTKTEVRFCNHCQKSTTFSVATWDSSCGGYTDWKYTCEVCGRGWWEEGIDS